MRVKIEIDSDNADVTPAYVGQVIEQIASSISEFFGETGGIIRDINGDKIGTWEADSSDYVKEMMEEWGVQ